MAKNDPAFPVVRNENVKIGVYDSRKILREYSGLTKREHFAALAMQGMMAGLVDQLNRLENEDDWNMEALAKMCCKVADACLDELNKG